MTLMGVRTYAPRLGRFPSVDPVVDGNANAYDYGDQDPINGADLDGRMWHNDEKMQCDSAGRPNISRYCAPGAHCSLY